MNRIHFLRLAILFVKNILLVDAEHSWLTSTSQTDQLFISGITEVDLTTVLRFQLLVVDNLV